MPSAIDGKTVDGKTIDLRALSHTREVVAYREGGLFPVLTTAPDGSIVAVLRGGAGHLGRAGRIDIVRSLDAGQTWTYPNIVADSDADDRNPGFGTSAKGTLVMSYARATSYDADGNYFPCTPEDAHKYWTTMVTRSFDSGLSWEDPYPLGIEDLSSGSPFGKMVTLTDGTLLMPLYARPAARVVGAQMSQMLPERFVLISLALARRRPDLERCLRDLREQRRARCNAAARRDLAGSRTPGADGQDNSGRHGRKMAALPGRYPCR